MSSVRTVLIASTFAYLGHTAQSATFNLGLSNVSFGVDGYADLRAVLPSDQTGWIKGGLGKLRYGNNSQAPQLRLGEIFAEGHIQIGGSLLVVGTARIEPKTKKQLSISPKPICGTNRSPFPAGAGQFKPVRSSRRFRWKTPTSDGQARGRSRRRRSTYGLAKNYALLAAGGRKYFRPMKFATDRRLNSASTAMRSPPR